MLIIVIINARILALISISREVWPEGAEEILLLSERLVSKIPFLSSKTVV